MQISTREARKGFYRSIKGQYGYAEPEVRRILKSAGFLAFRIEDIPEYRAVVKREYGRANGAQERMEKWKAKLLKEQEEQKPKLCPIPDCGGVQKRRHIFPPWECTVGGTIHYHIWRIAGIMETIRQRPHTVSSLTFDQRRTESMARLQKEINGGKQES